MSEDNVRIKSFIDSGRLAGKVTASIDGAFHIIATWEAVIGVDYIEKRQSVIVTARAWSSEGLVLLTGALPGLDASEVGREYSVSVPVSYFFRRGIHTLGGKHDL